MSLHIVAAVMLCRLPLDAVIARQAGEHIWMTIVWNGCCHSRVFSMPHLQAEYPTIPLRVAHIITTLISGLPA
jgi:hypothetical protein